MPRSSDTQLIVALTLGALLGTSAAAASEYQATTDSQRFSYALGFQIGARLSQQFDADELDIDAEALAAAIRDVLDETEPALSIEEMQQAMQQFQQQRLADLAAQAEENAARGDAFRAEYGQREGVRRTESGLQYRVITEGNGASPGAESSVVVHYQGTLVDGTEFDSSYKRGEPSTFAVNAIIDGWSEVLQLMNAGAKWEVVIPPELAYGDRGAGNAIGPNETLVFEIELLEIR